jgi:hypothetical protein
MVGSETSTFSADVMVSANVVWFTYFCSFIELSADTSFCCVLAFRLSRRNGMNANHITA